ncbi:MAG: HAD family hydrolase [Candidatus Binataceae bacterium]
MAADPVVFLLDVDNTLVNNDAIIADLMKHIEAEVGSDQQKRYWEYFAELRAELGYADYLGALQRYRIQYPRDLKILRASLYLVDYPFANRLFPDSLDVIEHAQKLGKAVVLSDGDVVFQPHKVERSGIYDAIGGNVLIYIHKETELDDVEARYPADHYMLVDDKVRILAAVKNQWGSRVTTVFPRQGQYARDLKEVAKYPEPDFTIERIGDFLKFDLDTLRKGAKPAS